MTAPSGGGNDINLAALWIPVMPETSHMGDEMRKAGAESKRQFEQGFNSGSSPESMGSSFGSKLTASISKEFQRFEIPFGGSAMLDKFSNDIDQKLVSKLRGQATQALQSYRAEWDNLTAAQGRAADAEQKIALARENGFSKASIMIPLIQEQTRAHTDLTAAQSKAGVALEDYTKKSGELKSVLSETASGGQILAGIMGGAMVLGAQLAVSAVEHLVEGIFEGFEKAIEITEELADKAIELGETYEHIGIQIHEFSSATGEQFEALEASAQHVFSTLDVAGADTGKTMAQLSSVLGASGEDIAGLVGHIEELQGRFTSLKSTDLSSIFVAFRTPAQEADTALASLLQSARNSGQDLGQLSSALSGNVAITLHEVGLNLQQAGAFTADLMKMGDPGRQAMGGLATAMKEFGKEGLSFSDGMQLAGQRLKELGDTAEGQDLAEKLFGTRNWIVAKDAVQDYMDVVAQGPDAFNASKASTDEFIDSTKTLGNEVETFKHKAEDAFKPFGEAAKNAATSGLNSISVWFTAHHTEIINDIKTWGDKLIDFLPTAQEWAADSIRIFTEFAAALLTLFSPVEQLFVAAGAGFLAMSGHFKEAKDLLEAGAKFDPSKIREMGESLADKIQSIHIDTDAIKENFDAAADAANRIPATVGSGLAGGITYGGTSPSMPGGGGPGMFPSPVAGAPPGAAPGGSGLFGGAFAEPGGAHVANWDAIAQSESSGNWADDNSGHHMTTSGAPRGGLQITDGTWKQFGGTEFAPTANLAPKAQQEEIANRILNGWNGVQAQGPAAWTDTYVGYAKGGSPTGRMVTSGSGSKDDVPALLKRGEYVWDDETVDKYGWLIKALHQGTVMGFDQGGGTDLDTKGAQVDTIAVAEAAEQLFGVHDIGMFRSADGYNEHASGEAADVMVGNNKDLGNQVAQYFLQNAGQFGVQYVLWQQKTWRPDGSSSPMEDRGSPTANHMNHVHVRTVGGGFPQGGQTGGYAAPSGGQTSDQPSAVAQQVLGVAGTMPGGKGGASFPGLPGQYGGGGVYGGETADQQYSAQQAVQEANDRKADLDYQVTQNQKKVDDLTAKLNAPPDPGELGLLTGQPLTDPATQKKIADKHTEIQNQLDEATHQLAVSQREAGEQTDKVSEAQRKQLEAQYKKPSSTSTGTPHAVGEQAFSQLGSSFLSGIGQELGFGDLFAKPPWEWGAFKLLTGAAGWAMNTANAWADVIGKGQTGMTGFQPIAGWDQQGGPSGVSSLFSGLGDSLGISLPKPSVSTGPNIVPGSVASGQGTGPAPGPVFNDNSIHVSSDVSDTKVLAPVQEQRNSSNASSFTNSGGFPAQ